MLKSPAKMNHTHRRIVVTPTKLKPIKMEIEPEEEVVDPHTVYRDDVFSEHERTKRSLSFASERLTESIRSISTSISKSKKVKQLYDDTIHSFNSTCDARLAEIEIKSRGRS